MGVMARAIKLAEMQGVIKKIGSENRQRMFGDGQKPSDYQQGPTASQNMGIMAGGIASPDMEDQYRRYLEEEKERIKQLTTQTNEGKSLLS